MMNICNKYFVVIFALFISSVTYGQVLNFDHGKIEFYTGTVVSDIEAISDKADVALNLKTGEVTVSIEIESFEFEYDLMQNHFNEKYMESEKFPKALFNGNIVQDISDGLSEQVEVDVAGKLTIHGITNDVKFKATLSKQDEFTVVSAKIPVTFNDYGIDDPSILTKSVAKEVEVKSEIYLKQTIM